MDHYEARREEARIDKEERTNGGEQDGLATSATASI
jgi:hypothetical protein